jgi:hypothetical protein
MKAACTALAVVACISVLLTASQAPALAQQDGVVTAKASAATKAAACDLSMDRALNLCMIRGLFSIAAMSCDCTQNNVSGASTWECVGTVACQK